MWKVGILAALTLSFGSLLQGCFPFDPFFPQPPADVGCFSDPVTGPIPSPGATPTTYRHASGTLVVTGTEQATVALTAFGDSTDPPMYDPTCLGGATAEFVDTANHWSVIVNAYTSTQTFGGATGPSEITVLRRSPQPFLFADGLTCATTITEADAGGLVGHAQCTGLVWDNSGQLDPAAASPSPTLPPFDATITFEARP